MYEEIQLNYFHPILKIGVEDVRNVWLLGDSPVKLTTCIHRGALVFRWPVSGKRVSYKTLKKGLIKKNIVFKKYYELLPF